MAPYVTVVDPPEFSKVIDLLANYAPRKKETPFITKPTRGPSRPAPNTASEFNPEKAPSDPIAKAPNQKRASRQAKDRAIRKTKAEAFRGEIEIRGDTQKAQFRTL